LIKILSILFYSIVKLLNLTYRYRFDGCEPLKELKGKNFVLAIWHQNLLAGIMAQTGKTHVVIISRSKDAKPVSYACNKLGHITKHGSSKKKMVDKGGKLAKDEMIEVMKTGIPGALTVDGPKGPAFEVKPGIIDMAKKANVMIVPYTLAFSSYWEFNSWDTFRIPKPFSKILISYGTPIDVSSETTDFLGHRLLVENALKEQTMKVNSRILNWDQYPRKNWFIA
jgi:lysophospholipid acyltransferase (LPLAT)-like uncharacterized protein